MDAVLTKDTLASIREALSVAPLPWSKLTQDFVTAIKEALPSPLVPKLVPETGGFRLEVDLSGHRVKLFTVKAESDWPVLVSVRGIYTPIRCNNLQDLEAAYLQSLNSPGTQKLLQSLKIFV